MYFCDECAPTSVVIGEIRGYMSDELLRAIIRNAPDDSDTEVVVREYARLRIDYNQLNEAHTRLQERGTELITENRRLKGVFDFDAAKILRSTFAADEGEHLATTLLESNLDWNTLVIDVRRVPVRVLISAYVYSFYGVIRDRRPELLPVARKIMWKTEYKWQLGNIESYVAAVHD